VGGLPTAVSDGVSGLLVDSHRTDDWTDALVGLLNSPGRRAVLADGARSHAERFSWRHTADGLLVAYRDAMVDSSQLELAASGVF
jgi:D-inositol-3-phosphate glycosyltransferase